jgi:hypothetical protein
MHHVSELTLHYMKSYGIPAPPTYARLLREACETHSPPHGMAWYGNMYRQLARKADWFANSLILNADKEGFGARQLWRFSVLMEDAQLAEQVRLHSMDESRHSNMFVGVLDLIFPSSLEASFREQLRQLSPRYTARNHPPTTLAGPDELLSADRVMEGLMEGNLTEVRALILQLLLRPVMQAYAPVEHREKLLRVSNRLIHDETKHIEYSAHFIERYAQQHPERARAAMLDAQKRVNDASLEEVSVEGLPIPI